ncbi:Uncharacterised protein [Bifidobacterium longum subsp. infantis]|nr:hypothetical protein BLIC_f00156 [Bifidobacterium longum subsp. infantis]SPU39648.1 Uncharacterised protein [Bifidobacterium longum subsp. infantis]VUX26377.1 hypothetical protein USA001_00112 [Bifidobacterium longum subsp. infantis]
MLAPRIVEGLPSGSIWSQQARFVSQGVCVGREPAEPGFGFVQVNKRR